MLDERIACAACVVDWAQAKPFFHRFIHGNALEMFFLSLSRSNFSPNKLPMLRWNVTEKGEYGKFAYRRLRGKEESVWCYVKIWHSKSQHRRCEEMWTLNKIRISFSFVESRKNSCEKFWDRLLGPDGEQIELRFPSDLLNRSFLQQEKEESDEGKGEQTSIDSSC